jgi:glucose/arabinose dehydrogenase
LRLAAAERQVSGRGVTLPPFEQRSVDLAGDEMQSVVKGAAFAALCVVMAPLAAQRSVPMNSNGIPVAPTGIVVPKLGAGPFEYHTAEGQDIRVVVHTRGLKRPWSLAFLPSGEMLVTERGGQLRVVRDGKLDPTPVRGVPEVQAAGLSGLLDVALHPDFAANRYVYLSYAKPSAAGRANLAVARGTWSGAALENVRDIFVTTDAAGVSRLAFGRDGMLYVSTAGGGESAAQDPGSLAGKVLRLHDDGAVPIDNPFAGKQGYKPEIYTLGHRSPLGLAVHPVTGAVWENENGPNGGDEINVLTPGANYGWPLVSLGRTYPGPWQSQGFSREGFKDPIVYWTPSIAVSGMAFYTGDKLAKWKGDVFVGGLRMGEIPGTGHLQRIVFNENMEELRREMLLVDLRQRIRDVRQGPDELLYLLTDEDDGAILRIEPAN